MKHRKILMISFFLLLIITLTSCHGTLVKSGETIDPDIMDYDLEFDENKEYNIEFWAKNDSNKAQQAVYNNAIESFNKYYPNIHVTIRNYSDYQTIYDDVINNISTNSTPNVCIAYPDHVATFLTGNNVVALDNYMNDSKYGLSGSEIKFKTVSKSEIVTKFLNEGVINNHQYLLPFMRSTEALYINKTYVEQLGYTIPDVVSWDFIWEVCSKAREERDKKQFDSQFYPFIYKSTDNMFIQLCKQYGYEYTTTSGENKFFTDEVASMLLNIGDKFDKNIFDTFANVSYPGNHMDIGNCIFAVDSTAGSTWIGYNHPATDHGAGEEYVYETEVRLIPQVDINNPTMISQGPSICIFNKEDKEVVTASWIFAEYLLNFDTQLAYSKTEGYSPVTYQVLNSDEYKTYLNDTSEYEVKRKATKLLSDNIDKTFITAVFNGSTNSRNAGGYLIEAMVGKKWRTEDKIKELYERVKNLYKIS